MVVTVACSNDALSLYKVVLILGAGIVHQRLLLWSQRLAFVRQFGDGLFGLGNVRRERRPHETAQKTQTLATLLGVVGLVRVGR